MTILRDYGTAAVHDFKAFSISENLQWFNQILKRGKTLIQCNFRKKTAYFWENNLIKCVETHLGHQILTIYIYLEKHCYSGWEV